MTLWQAERLAGEAIGLVLDGVEGSDSWLWERATADIWMPLADDAQAMRLVKDLHLHIDQRPGQQISVQPPGLEELVYGDVSLGNAALNKAIVQCAAKIQLSRKSPRQERSKA